MINNNYKKIINSKKKVNFFNKLKNYVYVYCKVDTKNNNKKTPIYIGVGKGLRCLSHLKELNKKTDSKSKLLKELDEKNLLTLDILAHGLDKDQVLTVESACIDLIGIENLENKIIGEYLDFSMLRKNIIISKDVVFKNKSNILKTDVIEIDIDTKNVKFYMNEKEKKVSIIKTN